MQEARKSSGFEITDRITLQWSGSAAVASAFEVHGTEIAEEVLATQVEQVGAHAALAFNDDEIGLAFSVAR